MGDLFGAQKTQTTEYRMSLHYGVCQGPVDEVKSISVSEKKVPLNHTANSSVTIDEPELFGGPKEAGGLAGRIYSLLGGSSQLLPEEFATKLNRTSSTAPGFRRMLSMVFLSPNSNEGFMWGSNNPVLPGIAVEVKRGPRTLDSDCFIGPDANPAHIVYEVMLDPDYGISGDPALIDRDSFIYSASLFRDENLGMSFQWVRSKRVETLISEIEQHTASIVVFNHVIGKWQMRPIRQIEGTENLMVLDDRDTVLKDYSRPAWGETVNEVQVSWTNPITEQEETVPVHHDANIRIEGGPVTDNKPYYGVRNKGLALRLGLRDLQAQSAPLARGTSLASRRFSSLVPGDRVFVNYPDDDFNMMVCRVLKTDLGETGADTVTINFVEDVFSSPYYAISGQESEWTDPSAVPIPLTTYYVGSANYYFVAKRYGSATADIAAPAAYALLVLPPSSKDTRLITYLSEEPDDEGDLVFEEQGDLDQQGTGRLDGDILKAFVSDVALKDLFGVPPTPKGFLLIVDSDGTEELCYVTAYAAGVATVRRGVLDTTPKAWSNNTRVFVIRPNTRYLDAVPRIEGDDVTYKFLPLTSLGRLKKADAPEVDYTLFGRMHKPTRPANLRLGGNPGPFVVQTLTDVSQSASWSRRNRKTETNVVLSWTEGDVSPESGQTTTLEVRNGAGTLLNTFAGLTGTSRSMSYADMGSPASTSIRRIYAYAVRDGIISEYRALLEISYAEPTPGALSAVVVSSRLGYAAMSLMTGDNTDAIRVFRNSSGTLNTGTDAFGSLLSASSNSPMSDNLGTPPTQIQTDGDFNVPASWAVTADYSVAGGKAVKSSANTSTIRQTVTLAPGDKVRWEAEMVSSLNGGPQVRLYGGTQQTGAAMGAAGAFFGTLTAVSGNNALGLVANLTAGGVTEYLRAFIETAAQLPQGNNYFWFRPQRTVGGQTFYGPISGPWLVVVR